MLKLKKIFTNLILVLLIVIAILAISASDVKAEDGSVQIDGVVFEFDKSCDYVFEDAQSYASTSEGAETAGTFVVSGNIGNIAEIQDVPYYIVDSGNLTISYIYSNQMEKDEDEWHIVKDSGKKIDSMALDTFINSGILVLQTSRDGEKWNNAVIKENTFENVPNRTEPIYTTTDTELKNGCYYRLIVAYEKGIKTGSTTILGINLGSKYDCKRIAEVYTFCACSKSSAEKKANTETLKYSYSDFTKVKNDDGYSTPEEMEYDDPHYSNELGNFYVEGYTSQKRDNEGNMIFLCNPGDEMTLYFNLKTDIDALWEDSNLSIADDDKGYDSYFQVDLTDMGRGTLLVQHTDPYSEQTPVTPYKDYLAACISAGADTVVQINEEGDYEVKLDYKIKKKIIFGMDILPEYSSYTMHFKFSVRNGNCMVYPFDLSTGSELTNASFAPNGFKLDFAKSKYLEINVKKEILNSNGSALVEDTRFNKPAKEGDEFTDEGIYTLTAHNIYTDQYTIKTIYVGNDSVLKAYVMTGLPIKEINSLIQQGATIDDDGNIMAASVNVENDNNDIAGETIVTTETISENNESNQQEPMVEENPNNESTWVYVIIAAIVIIIVLVVIVLIKKKNKGETKI